MTILATGPLAACSRATSLKISGVTMGTTYSVTILSAPDASSRASLHAEIDRTLNSIIASMSTYDRASELSRLNRSLTTDWQPVSSELFTVLEAALDANNVSHGAFDVTVGPLVDLWGFGPALRNASVPRISELKRTHKRVGSHLIRLSTQSSAVAKVRRDVQIDLSSIAKGYGVDRVASLLESNGVRDYLVEIGGEIRVRRSKLAQGPWRIAIDSPVLGNRRTTSIIELDDGAVATSGNTRDFFELDGRCYPHVLDPVSGRPVDHPPMSVSVVSNSAMQADALATALLVMGPDAGYRFADRNGVAALFLGLDGEALTTDSTPAMKPLIAS